MFWIQNIVFKEQVSLVVWVSVSGCVYLQSLMTKAYRISYLCEVEPGTLNNVSQSEDRTQWISLGMKQTGIDVILIHTLHQVTPREKKKE